jgi:hypothetical protein
MRIPMGLIEMFPNRKRECLKLDTLNRSNVNATNALSAKLVELLLADICSDLGAHSALGEAMFVLYLC